MTKPPQAGSEDAAAGLRSIPEASVARLAVYLRKLGELAEEGAETVSSDELAAETRRQPFTGYRLDEPRITEAVEVTARLTGPGGAERTRVYEMDTAGTTLCIGVVR